MIILGMFLPDNLLIADDDAGYRVFFELLFLWYAVYEVATFPEKLSAVRFSPEEIKNIRALQKRGGARQVREEMTAFGTGALRRGALFFSGGAAR